MNIPNTITVIRILLVPALVCFLLQQAFTAAIAVFLVAGVSDALDGFLARRLGQMTRLGALLDPLADKLLVVSSVLVLAWLGHLPRWLAITVITRDLLILAAAAHTLRKSADELPPSVLSKINTFVQLTLIFFVLTHAGGMLAIAPALPPLYLISFVTTIVSGMHYAIGWLRGPQRSAP